MLLTKVTSLMMVAAISLATPGNTLQQGELINASTAMEDQNSGYNDDGESGRRIDAGLANEDIMYLTDPEAGERVTEVEADGEYILHCYLVNNGELESTVENVSVLIGQGDDYYSVRLNLLVGCKDAATGEKEKSTSISVVYPVANRETDAWLRFRPVGKAKLYNSGRLNGAQVNHKRLFSSKDISSGIYVGYDDQDGILPYGEDYACEIRMRVKLASTEPWNQFWSDTDVHDDQNSGYNTDQNTDQEVSHDDSSSGTTNRVYL